MSQISNKTRNVIKIFYLLCIRFIIVALIAIDMNLIGQCMPRLTNKIYKKQIKQKA